ncbi:MAG: antibiotic biosynthesis monooxygenase [Proteobacteria bacterium]|nr:antibiotic biosynthesis monooxygenase [Pseudomonadota bacterium]
MKQHYVTIFRSRLKPEYQEEYSIVANRMSDLVHMIEGFVGYKTFTAADGERVTIAEFDSAQSQDVWRRHPEHLEAQKKGREKFYAEYHIQVCSLVRDYSHGSKRQG